MWYTSTPREHEAGILEVGHFVTDQMVIPPNVDNFTTTGVVPSDCTSVSYCSFCFHCYCVKGKWCCVGMNVRVFVMYCGNVQHIELTFCRICGDALEIVFHILKLRQRLVCLRK